MSYNRHKVSKSPCLTIDIREWDDVLQGVTILMMGSKEEDVPTEPVEKPLFVEDMNESELASAVSVTVWY